MDSDVIILEDEDETQEEVQHGKDRSQSSDDEEEEDSNKTVWSKGDRCRAVFSQDGCYYEAHIKQIKRGSNGKVSALVRYSDYGTEDEEEVDVNVLKRSPRDRRWKKKPQARRSGAGTSSEKPDSEGGLFSPLVGNEEQRRLEAKFKALEEDEWFESPRHVGKTTPKATTSRRRLLDSPIPNSSQRRKRKGTVTQGGDKVIKNKAARKKDDPKSVKSSKEIQATDDSAATLEEEDNRSDSCDTSGLKFTEPRSSQKATSNVREKARSVQQNTLFDSGFEDEELEKPRFHHPAPNPKEPFSLSSPESHPSYQIPATINQYLRDYQREGVQFLFKHYTKNRGAILGDDMGLGKTVQVISFIAAIQMKTGTKADILQKRPQFIRKMSDNARSSCSKDAGGRRRPFLIVGPACVMYNWIEEFETWGHFTIGKYHGIHKEQTLADLERNRLDVVVTTFETFRDSVDELNRFDWESVIVDEVHKIKGVKSRVTAALNELTTKRRYGLTGTALQNNMTELWSVLNWANPGCLGKLREFDRQFVKKMERGQKHSATKRELAEARKMKEKFAVSRNAYMLRRTKSIISHQLPKKDELVVYCKPTAFQIDIYKGILDHEDVRLILTSKDPCLCNSGLTKGKCCYREVDGRSIKALMFTYLTLLLKAANHVSLLTPSKSSSEYQQRKTAEICDRAFEQYPQFLSMEKQSQFLTLSDPRYCGKMKVVKGILGVLKKEKSKVLLFSYSTQLLDILEQYISSEGFTWSRIDGQTSSKKRWQVVQDFNRDPEIFICLISTRAGGLGLNLTGANVVIIYDPNWNPAHDLQAQDRAYRIGQRKDVRVYRLISAGTIEENIYLRQIYKQQLGTVAVGSSNAKRYFHGIQGDRHNKGELFGLENMFTFRGGTSCLTTDIIERNKKIEVDLGGYEMSKYIPPSNSSAEEGNKEKEEEERDVEEEEEEESEGDYGLGEFLEDIEQQDEISLKTEKTTKKDSRKSLSAEEEDVDPHGLDYICSQFEEEEECSDDDSGKTSVKKETPKPKKSLVSDKISSGRTPSTSMYGEGQGYGKQRKRNGDNNKTQSDYGNEGLLPLPGTSKDMHMKTPVSKRQHYDSDKSQRKNKRVAFLKEKKSSVHDISSSEEEEEREEEEKRDEKEESEEERVEEFGGTFDEDVPSVRRQKEKKKQRIVVSRDKKKATEKLQEEESYSSVGDVFEKLGVLHVHENRRLIGGSRAEDHMTKCAMQDVFERHMLTQMPAAHCDPLSELEEVEEPTPTKVKIKSQRGQHRKKTPNRNIGPRTEIINNKKILIGQTPRAIKRMQFKQLMGHLGHTDEINLAQLIIRSSKRERMEMLKGFYTQQEPALERIFPIPQEQEPSIQEAPSTSRNPVKRPTQRRTEGAQFPARTQIQKRHVAVKKKSPQKGCQYEEDGNDSESDRQQIGTGTSAKATSGGTANKKLAGMSKVSKSRKVNCKTKKSQRFVETFDEFLGFPSSDEKGSSDSDSEMEISPRVPPRRSRTKEVAKDSTKRQVKYCQGVSIKESNRKSRNKVEDAETGPSSVGLGDQKTEHFTSRASSSKHHTKAEEMVPSTSHCSTQKSKLVNPRSDPDSTTNMLDNLFFEAESPKKAAPKRRAPPKKLKQEDDLDILNMLHEVEKGCHTYRKSSIGNVNTPKNMSIIEKDEPPTSHSDLRKPDGFWDSCRWKRTKRKSPLIGVDTSTSISDIISHDQDAYNALFKEGKMQKREKGRLLVEETPSLEDDTSDTRESGSVGHVSDSLDMFL